MSEKGIQLIKNPSLLFMENEATSGVIGKCRSIVMEGIHPIMIEVEALAIPSIYAYPKRFSEGVDVARINRIAAILDKHAGQNCSNYDIYCNLSGGFRTKDVAIDFAIAMAIYSSKNKKEIVQNSVFLGELSLTGKIRNVTKMAQRLREAKKIGIENYYTPEKEKDFNNCFPFKTINESISQVFL